MTPARRILLPSAHPMRLHAILAPFLAVGCGLNTFGLTDGAAQLSTGESPTAPTATGEVETQSTQVGMTDTPSTGAADNCELAPECAAGAVEDGAPCESCGFLRRTCQADCTWTPLACEQDLDSCAYWVLPAGQQAWERVPVDANASFAPQTTVLAAIGLAPQQQIYVLTANSYHVLSTATGPGSPQARATVFSPSLPEPRCILRWASQ